MATGVTSVLHPSPSAASLGKFHEIPVSLHTGIPAINVPIWQLRQGDISVDIGLNYHSSGTLVDEVASCVGMGWSMSGGGMITRSTRGLPDNVEQFRQFDQPRINRFHDRTLPNTMSNQERQTFILNVYRGVLDAEPDLYSVSVGGLSCRFFMGPDGEFVAAPRDPSLRIQHNVPETRNGNTSTYTWVITDGTGTRYKFGSAEFTSSRMYSQADGGPRTDGGEFEGETSWGITEIEDAKGNRVHFTYEADASDYTSVTSEFISVPTTTDVRCQVARTYSFAENHSSALRLARITCGLEEVRFIADPAERADSPGSHSLRTIEVRYDGQVRKRFQLFTSYLGNNSVGTQGVNFPQEPSRLRLDSLREESGDGQKRLPAYLFTYAPGDLPPRNSAAQDHWGFYNGQPNTMRVSYTVAGRKHGANKEPNAVYAVAGTLTGIRYPTGGHITFEYEGNTYVDHTGSVTKDTAFISLMGHNAIPLTNPNKYQTDFHFEADFEVTARMAGSSGRMSLLPTISREITGSTAPPWQGGTITLYVLNTATREIISFNDYGQTVVWSPIEQRYVLVPAELVPGSYKLMADIRGEFPNDPEAPNPNNIDYFIGFGIALSTAMHLPPMAYNAPGPGLRIKKITKDFGTGSPTVISYNYMDPATGVSSGVLGNYPEYITKKIYNRIEQLAPDQPLDRYVCACDEFVSNSRYPLINSKASYIGYSHVTEQVVDAKQAYGKKTYTYTNYDQYNDISTPAFPYPPNSSQDWKRGMLLTEKAWRRANSSSSVPFVLQQRDSSVYDTPASSVYRTVGIKVGCSEVNPTGVFVSEAYLYSKMAISEYPVESNRFQLQLRASARLQNGQNLETTTAYGYTDRGLLRKSVTRNSDGSTTTSRFNYPTDYSSNANQSPVLAGLLAANMVNMPIEQTIVRQTTTSARLVAGTVHEYKADTSPAGNRYFLHKIYTARTEGTDTIGRYTFLVRPAYYEETARITGISRRGQPLTQLTQRRTVTGYHWGYDERYAIAECANASDAEFYYEGFEEAPMATAGPGHTGNRYVSGSYTVSWPRPNTRTYVLSYWYRLNGTWHYTQVPYNGAVSLTGGDAYDDIRIHPVDARLTTFTFDPLIGITSKTDPSGRTSYYEYDTLNRLQRLRDEQGRVLIEQEYKYVRQP